MIRKHNHKIKVSILFLIMMSLFTVSISAWFDTSQHKTNQFKLQDGIGVVFLTKYGVLQDGTLLQSGLKDVSFDLYKVDGTTETKLQMTLTTNEEGLIKVEGLSSGEYFFEELAPPPGYEYEKDETGSEIRRHYFTIDTDVNHGVVHMQVKNIRIEGAFLLEKQVIMNENSQMSDHKDKLFEFRITFGDKVDNPSLTDETLYPYVLSDGSSGYLKNGETLKLKGNQTARFNTIPYGTPYRVEEIPQDGYIISSKYSSGNHLNNTHVLFNNLVSNDETGMIILSKEVVAMDGTSLASDSYDKRFEFTITFSDGGTHKAKYADDESIEIASGDTVTLKHGDVLTLYDLPFGLEYSIVETNYEADGYYAQTDKVIGNVGNNSKSIHYPFTNIYEGGSGIPSGLTGILSLTKEVINPYHANHEFEFTITFDQDFNGNVQIGDGPIEPFVNGMTLKLRNLQELRIEGVPYGARYSIQESEKDDYIILSETYEGTLLRPEASIIVYNNYDGPETREGYLDIIKTVVGNDTDQSFDFELHVNGEIVEFSLKDGDLASFTYEAGTHYALYEKDYRDQGYVLSLVNGQGTIKKGENIEIQAINTYDKALEKIDIKGEKTWDLKGNKDARLPKSIVLDLLDAYDNILETIEVTPDDQGKWTYELKVPKYDALGELIDYELSERPIKGFSPTYDGFDVKNTYYGVAHYAPQVEKKIVGEPKELTHFDFEIQALDGAPLLMNTWVRIEGTGMKKFEVIEYDSPGIYKYVINEKENREGDYLYDTVPVLLSVKVENTGEGLAVTEVQYEKNGEVFDRACFTNTYVGEDDPSKPVDPPVNPEDPKDPPSTPEEPDVPVLSDENPKPSRPGGNGSEIGDLPLPHTGVADSKNGAKAALFVAIGLAFILYNLKKKNEELLNYEKD